MVGTGRWSEGDLNPVRKLAARQFDSQHTCLLRHFRIFFALLADIWATYSQISRGIFSPFPLCALDKSPE